MVTRHILGLFQSVSFPGFLLFLKNILLRNIPNKLLNDALMRFALRTIKRNNPLRHNQIQQCASGYQVFFINCSYYAGRGANSETRP